MPGILALLQALLPAFQIAGPILSSLVPTLAPIIGALGVVQPNSHTNVVSLIQEGLNALQAVGEVQFDGTGKGLGTPLVVDGIFGGRMFGAIKALQTKLGITVQEPLASMEYTLVAGLLAKL